MDTKFIGDILRGYMPKIKNFYVYFEILEILKSLFGVLREMPGFKAGTIELIRPRGVKIHHLFVLTIVVLDCAVSN